MYFVFPVFAADVLTRFQVIMLFSASTYVAGACCETWRCPVVTFALHRATSAVLYDARCRVCGRTAPRSRTLVGGCQC